MLVIAASYRDYELIIRCEVHTTHTELVAAKCGCNHQRADTPHLQCVPMMTCHVSPLPHLDTWPMSHLPRHQVASVAGQGEAGDCLPNTEYLMR